MKLKDLEEAVSVSKNMKFTDIPALKDVNNNNILGAGVFSTVVQTADKKLVKKQAEPDEGLKKDAYFQYAQFVYVNHLAQENPYFPKIQEIRMDSEPYVGLDDIRYHVIMERLIETDKMKVNDLKNVIRKIFTKDAINDWETFEDEDSIHSLGDNMEILLGAFESGGELTRWFGKENIKDQKLIEAMDIIQKLISLNRKRGFRWDLHSGNFMFRKTATGYQMVLSDPIAPDMSGD